MKRVSQSIVSYHLSAEEVRTAIREWLQRQPVDIQEPTAVLVDAATLELKRDGRAVVRVPTGVFTKDTDH